MNLTAIHLLFMTGEPRKLTRYCRAGSGRKEMRPVHREKRQRGRIDIRREMRVLGSEQCQGVSPQQQRVLLEMFRRSETGPNSQIGTREKADHEATAKARIIFDTKPIGKRCTQ